MFFYSDHVCEHVMCWGTLLYCEQCVFKCTAVGFTEALKPFVGLFHNGSILSFALVQGIDPESFECNWIPMQVLSCNHLVPHHCWVEGQPGRAITGESSNLWMCLHSLEIESKGTMATWQIRTELLLHFHTHGTELNWAIQGCLGIYLSVVVTALQWSLGKDRVITVWSWYDNVKRISRLLQLTLPHPTSASQRQPYIYRKCYKYMR